MATTTKTTTKAKRTTTLLSVRPATVRIYQQTGSDSTYYATWQWSKTPTDHYEVEWVYFTGDGIAFPLSTDSVTTKKSICSSVPSNATSIGVRLRAWGPNYTKESGREDDSNVPQWKTNWTNRVTYYRKHDAPKDPGTPTCTIQDDGTLVVELNINPYELNCTKVSFSIFREDGTYVKSSGALEIKNMYVRWTTTVAKGYVYKARAFTYNDDGEKSDPGGYSGNVGTMPNDVTGITSLKTVAKTSVRVEWPAVSSATGYDVEYTTDKNNFDSSGDVSSQTVTNNYAIISGLESGEEWFFRVRATNSYGNSGWTEPKSIIVGEKPSAPTTWSSTSTVIVGEKLILYWVHNSEDNSSQESAILELTIGGTTTTYTIPNDRPEEDKDKTSTYEIDTSAYPEGTEIKWRVQTKGIVDEYSDWSVLRIVNVYAKPTLALSVTNKDGQGIETLTSYPILIKTQTGPSTQTPLSYHLTVIANESYEDEDEIGNFKMVIKDSEIFRQFFDTSKELEYELSANNIDLKTDISYTIKCVVAMNSGLTAEDEFVFNVDWDNENDIEPELEFTFNESDYSMTLLPSCSRYPIKYYKVNKYRNVYTTTTEEISEQSGEELEETFTTAGDQVYKTTDSSGGDLYYTILQSSDGILVDGVTLSVYRREFDGTFVELGKGIPNDKSSYVADPHPSLNYARYRVIATDIDTGNITYVDVTGYEINCPYAIIQWDENWSDFNGAKEDGAIIETEFEGSMVTIKGNIDVSDKNQADVTLIEYIGRKHPVSYYGTQLGTSSTWNMEFDKKDEDTLYALRRLAIWMGDCYVREPSGSGYWARVEVSFSQKHCEVTIPVTMELTRVEGGI